MKIEEQIMNDPNLACYVDKQRGWIHEAFMDGVRWADKTMIDKACEWLSKTLYLHTEEIEDKHWNETKTFDWVTSDYDSVSDFINGFRKALEGE